MLTILLSLCLYNCSRCSVEPVLTELGATCLTPYYKHVPTRNPSDVFYWNKSKFGNKSRADLLPWEGSETT